MSAARWVEVGALVALAWTVAVPLSSGFARVRWTAREPVASLVLWQAIGLSGGLAVLTAELTLVAAGERGPWRDAVADALSAPGSVGVVGAVGLALFAGSAGWLIAVLVASFVRVVRSRREHRAVLELLAEPAAADDGRYQLIEASTPVAYSLPGRTSHVVVSSGARAELDAGQLRAVLAHERAHLRQRHSVLVQPFIAWEQSLPFLTSPARARRRVEQLVEMVCDDDAIGRGNDPHTLAGALTVLAPPGPAVDERLARLTDEVGPRKLRQLALVSSAVLLVAGPPVTLLCIAV